MLVGAVLDAVPAGGRRPRSLRRRRPVLGRARRRRTRPHHRGRRGPRERRRSPAERRAVRERGCRPIVGSVEEHVRRRARRRRRVIVDPPRTGMSQRGDGRHRPAPAPRGSSTSRAIRRRWRATRGGCSMRGTGWRRCGGSICSRTRRTSKLWGCSTGVEARSGRSQTDRRSLTRRNGETEQRRILVFPIKKLRPPFLRVMPVVAAVLSGCSVRSAASRRHPLSRGGDERVEQRPRTRRSARNSPGATARRCRSARRATRSPSITPSGAVAVATSPRPSRADRLVVTAVDAARARRVDGAPERLVQARAGRDRARRARRASFGCVDAVRAARSSTARRDVLDERAAGGDVQHLRAAADREERQVRRPSRGARDRSRTRRGRARHRRPSGCRVLAVEHRIDVAAAGQQRGRRARHERPRALADLEHARRARPPCSTDAT